MPLSNPTTHSGATTPPGTPVSQLPKLPAHSGTAVGQDDSQAEGMSFGLIWQAVSRRRRLALLVGSLVASLAFASTLWQRAFSPIYLGSFQLLVSDPINSEGATAAGATSIETLARNRTTIDFPSLVQTLRSPMVLDPLRNELGPAGYLVGAAEISQLGDAEGVLQVSLTGSEPGAV